MFFSASKSSRSLNYRDMQNAPQGVINCDKFDHFDQFHIAVSLNILVAKKSQDYRSDNLKPSLTLTLCAVCHKVNGASTNKKLSNGCWEIRNQPTFSFYDDHSHLLCSRTEHRNTNFRNWDAR